MVSSGLLRRVALVITDVSEEPGALVFLRSVRRLLVADCVVPSSPILSPWWRRRQVSPKRRFLQEPHGVTTQKTPFFIVTDVKTSNLTQMGWWWQKSTLGKRLEIFAWRSVFSSEIINMEGYERKGMFLESALLSLPTGMFITPFWSSVDFRRRR
jgi:hypothetical protein